jgi:hypothetical protein
VLPKPRLRHRVYERRACDDDEGDENGPRPSRRQAHAVMIALTAVGLEPRSGDNPEHTGPADYAARVAGTAPESRQVRPSRLRSEGASVGASRRGGGGRVHGRSARLLHPSRFGKSRRTRTDALAVVIAVAFNVVPDHAAPHWISRRVSEWVPLSAWQRALAPVPKNEVAAKPGASGLRRVTFANAGPAEYAG